MYKNLRWKIITILVVFAVFCAIGPYPLLAARYHLPNPGWVKANALKLGLDLKGGVQLRMRVNTDDALRITTTGVSQQLLESLKTSGINVTVSTPSANTFRVEGVPPDKDSAFRAASDEAAGPQYDRNPQPGGAYVFTMKPNIARDLQEQAVDQTMQTIDRRVNELGVTEPSIARQSNGDELLIQLPGVTDIAHAKDIIGKTAQLEFKLVESGPTSSKDDLLKQYNGQLPGDMEILPGSSERGGGGEVIALMPAEVGSGGGGRALGDGDAGDAEQDALEGGGDGSGVGDVVAEVVAVVDAGDDQVGALTDEAEVAEADAVDGGAVGGVAGGAVTELDLGHGQRAVDGDATGRAAAVGVGGDDGDGAVALERELGLEQPSGGNSVVVREQDVHGAQSTGRRGHGSPRRRSRGAARRSRGCR